MSPAATESEYFVVRSLRARDAAPDSLPQIWRASLALDRKLIVFFFIGPLFVVASIWTTQNLAMAPVLSSPNAMLAIGELASQDLGDQQNCLYPHRDNISLKRYIVKEKHAG